MNGSRAVGWIRRGGVSPRLLRSALVLGLATGGSLSVLGWLRMTGWWPPRTTWTVRPAPVPNGDWLAGWSPTALSVSSLEGRALSLALWVAGGLALLLFVAAVLHVVLALLAEVAERDPESALLAAVGATGRQLRRESLRRAGFAAMAGAGLGLLLGLAGRALLRQTAPAGLVLGGSGSSGGEIPAWVVLAAGCGAILAAAWRTAPDTDALRRPARRVGRLAGPSTGGGPRGLTHGAGGPAGWLLAAGQVGAAVAVTVAAMLLLRGVPWSPALLGGGIEGRGSAAARPARGADPLILRVWLPSGADRAATWRSVRSALLRLPGVEQAAVASPGAYLGLGTLDRVGALCPRCIARARFGLARYMAVGAGFFEVLGHPVDRGGRREPEALVGRPDSTEPVVDQAFVRHLFAGGNGVGLPVWLNGALPLWGKGVAVGGVTDLPPPVGLRPPPAGVPTELLPLPKIYLSAEHYPPAVADVAVRSEEGVDADEVRGPALRLIAAQAPGARIETLGRLSDLERSRLGIAAWLAQVATLIAVLCLLLALYAVIDTLRARVRARAAELNLRRAVGARRGDVRRLVLRDSLRLVSAGAAAGSILATGLDRGLPLLFPGLEPLPLWALAVIALGLVLLGTGAAVVVAWRVLRLQPARMAAV